MSNIICICKLAILNGIIIAIISCFLEEMQKVVDVHSSNDMIKISIIFCFIKTYIIKNNNNLS